MANHTHNSPKYVFRRAAYIIAALLVLSALVAGVTYARYAMGIDGKGSVTSPDFYFSSDLLGTPAPTYTLNPGMGGTTSFTFQVHNFVDALRINEKDIKVTVAVQPSDGITVAIDKDTLTGVTADGVTADSATVTVSGLKNGESYTITATGESGFVSTLSANVTVKPDEPNIYMHLNDADDYYVLLTVWTRNLEGTVSITYPEGLIPDATDPGMSEVNNLSEGSYVEGAFTDTVNFTATYSSHVYRFFKNTPGQDITDGFGASINGVKAESAIPE